MAATTQVRVHGLVFEFEFVLDVRPDRNEEISPAALRPVAGEEEKADAAPADIAGKIADGLLHLPLRRILAHCYLEAEVRQGPGHVLRVVGGILQRGVFIGAVSDEKGDALFARGIGGNDAEVALLGISENRESQQQADQQQNCIPDTSHDPFPPRL